MIKGNLKFLYPLVFVTATFYILPIFLGYSWNMISGPSIINTVYKDLKVRYPASQITAEPWGAAVINIPFLSRVKQAITNLEAPLWNPYQGLGQPFLAQGEGNPLSIFSIIRSLLPVKANNIFTFFIYFASAIFFALSISKLGLSNRIAYFGSVIYILSTPFSFHIARDNIAEQNAITPVCLYAFLCFVDKQRMSTFIFAALSVYLCATSGFIQAGFINLLAVYIVSLFMIFYWHRTRYHITPKILYLTGACIIGAGLASYYLWPILEIIHIGYHKNTNPDLGSGTLSNLIVFLSPGAFGAPLDSFSTPADWPNLFATSSFILMCLTLIGFTSVKWETTLRRQFYFFSIFGFVLLFRYMGYFPFYLLNKLPIIGMQTPKHANAITSFLFLVSSLLVLDNLSYVNSKRAAITILIMVLFYTILLCTFKYYRFGKYARIDLYLVLFYSLSLICAFAWKHINMKNAQAIIALIAALELAFYIPMGTLDSIIYLDRVEALAYLFLAGCSYIFLRKFYRTLFVSVFIISAIVTFNNFIADENVSGLPSNINFKKVSVMNGAVSFLLDKCGLDFRTLGFMPEYSSMYRLRDLGVVGPFAPTSFAAMILVTADSSVIDQFRSSEFIMASRRTIHMNSYINNKPIFSWLSLKYLIFDKSVFNEDSRIDDKLLLENNGFIKVYEDNVLKIIESSDARPSVEFYSNFSLQMNQMSILSKIKADPILILGFPMLEWDPDLEDFQNRVLLNSIDDTRSPETNIEGRSLNTVDIKATNYSRGLLVLKEAYFPGWQVYVDGVKKKLLRVNGMVQGVILEEPGAHNIRFIYRPVTFYLGFACGAILFLLLLLGYFWNAKNK